MIRHAFTFSLLFCLGFPLLVGCVQKETSHETQDPSTQVPTTELPKELEEIPWELQPEAPPLPEGIRLEKRALFYLDTTTPSFETTLRGDKRYSLIGNKEDRFGRRSIHLQTPFGKEEIAPSDWHMPPTGAMNPNGHILVCYNRLIGKTSRITEGMMPDPTQGVLGFCRLRTKQGWQRPFKIGSLDRVANWVTSVTAMDGGVFRVQYQADDGWFFDPDIRHSIFAHTIEDGTITKTSFVRSTLKDGPDNNH